MRRPITFLSLASFLCLLISCNNADYKVAESLSEIDISVSPDNVVELPAGISPVVTDIFTKYTRVEAPNGKAIHMLAQAEWTDDQIIKARNVLTFLLTDFPGSEYGSDKSEIANSMADRSATMVLFKDPEAMDIAFSSGLWRLDLSMQDLRANECPWEGSDDYMNHLTRDASYEEIWHLVHDNGIKQVVPDMIAELRKANDLAAEAGWDAYPDDEPQEHPNEYFSVLIDNYYELWTVKPKLYEGNPISDERLPDGHSHFGRYFATTRDKVEAMDPGGFELIEKFLPPYLTYEPVLPEDFNGCFSLELNTDEPYTWKSQHLKDVSLSGINNSNIIGNAFDNKLTGNKGDNKLAGGPGDDTINGLDGSDTVILSGNFNEYTLVQEKDGLKISDKISDRDGNDKLSGIEFLKFKDKTIETLTLIK